MASAGSSPDSGVTVRSPLGTPPAAAARLALPLDLRRARHVALVANGKPNSAELLDAVAERLVRRQPGLVFRRYRKPSVSVPPDPVDVAEIAEWADATLHAVGD